MAPLRPEIRVETQPRNGAFEIDQTLEATCISRDGRPPAEIVWFLDDEPLLEGIARPEEFESQTGDGAKLYTVQRSISRILKANDDGRHLICRTNHPAQPGKSEEARVQLRINCKLVNRAAMEPRLKRLRFRSSTTSARSDRVRPSAQLRRHHQCHRPC